jgi:hypothetical protein
MDTRGIKNSPFAAGSGGLCARARRGREIIPVAGAAIIFMVAEKRKKKMAQCGAAGGNRTVRASNRSKSFIH